jgi:Family of unknown function (DUF6188)
METDPLQEYQLVEHDDYWAIPLLGQRVSRFKVDMQLTLEFFERADEETTVWISGEFKVEADGKKRLLSAEQRETVGPVFALLNRTVQSALAYKNGTLEITFTEGGKLSVPADPHYESWGVTGVRWLRVVCMPGGELAVWLADPPGGKTTEQSEAEKELARQSREITTLINILEPDLGNQPIMFSNEITVVEVLGKSEEELNKRLEVYLGNELKFSAAQPLHKLLAQIKEALPDWPDVKRIKA